MDNSPFDFYTWMAAGIGSMLTAAWNWLRQRKRDDAALKTAEIENVEKAIEIWRRLAQDMRTQVEELKFEVKELSSKVEHMHGENNDLRSQIGTLSRENQKLIKQIEDHIKSK